MGLQGFEEEHGVRYDEIVKLKDRTGPPISVWGCVSVTTHAPPRVRGGCQRVRWSGRSGWRARAGDLSCLPPAASCRRSRTRTSTRCFSTAGNSATSFWRGETKESAIVAATAACGEPCAPPSALAAPSGLRAPSGLTGPGRGTGPRPRSGCGRGASRRCARCRSAPSRARRSWPRRSACTGSRRPAA